MTVRKAVSSCVENRDWMKEVLLGPIVLASCHKCFDVACTFLAEPKTFLFLSLKYHHLVIRQGINCNSKETWGSGKKPKEQSNRYQLPAGKFGRSKDVSLNKRTVRNVFACQVVYKHGRRGIFSFRWECTGEYRTHKAINISLWNTWNVLSYLRFMSSFRSS